MVMPALEPAFRMRVQIGAPQDQGTWDGQRRRIMPITGGTVEGSGFSGIILPGGADWQTIRVADGVARIDARYTLRHTDGTLVTMFDQGVRRYGFHGLSYEYLAVALDESFGSRAHGRVIAAHLGSGASLCAMRDCRSVATTMGFSALDGLMMSTRCGTLDPGVVLHLLEAGKLSGDALGHLLYHESGLKGVSGASGGASISRLCVKRTGSVGLSAVTLPSSLPLSESRTVQRPAFRPRSVTGPSQRSA